MNKYTVNTVVLAVTSAMVLGLCSCKTGMGGTETEAVVAMEGGVMVVDTITINATVVEKDAAKRKLVLQSNDTGARKTFKATPEMKGFDQVNVGDQVQAVVTEEVAVYIGAGDPSAAAASGTVMVSPDGAKPAGVVAVTSKVTVVVTAVDAKKHKVTFKLPDGSFRTIKVDKKMDLSNVPVGESVTVVIGEGLAISVTAP